MMIMIRLCRLMFHKLVHPVMEMVIICIIAKHVEEEELFKRHMEQLFVRNVVDMEWWLVRSVIIVMVMELSNSRTPFHLQFQREQMNNGQQ